ncbi:MAG: Zn-dependent alcohol dehydrogenase [Caldilineaceae bacterium]
MKIQAALARTLNNLTVETVDLDPPKAHEVLVRMKAAGVCHSDLHTLRGELRATPPIVLGHEGAGVIEAVGSAVTRFQPGQRVMINWLPSCNQCPTCLSGLPNLCERFPSTTFQAILPEGTSRLKTEDGVQLKHFLSSATMADYAVIDESGIIPIPDNVPFDVAAITGCAVITGVGAVLNTAQVKPGAAAAVIGCGGVGLSALLGCVLAGCSPIIAVDVMPSKLAMARELGATHTINGREVNAVEEMKKIVRGGPDYVFDSVGAASTMAQAVSAARPGGTAVVSGMHATKVDVPIPAGALIFQNKRLLGSFAGSAKPQVDLPHLLSLYRAGRLPIDKLISKHYRLDEIVTAFADMEGGSVARGVILFD